MPKNSSIRPTTDIVRMAIFSIIYKKIYNAVIFDLFAGSGILGLEALSRGASFCHFLDIDCRYLKKNITLVSSSKYNIINGDFFRIASKIKQGADIIFIDPPYGKYKSKNILETIATNKLIKYNGLIVYEERKDNDIMINSGLFKIIKERVYGDTKITFIEVQNGYSIPRDI